MIPAISREGMIEVDRIMVEDLSIPVSLMMEQAGLNLAKIAIRYANRIGNNRFLVIVGSGNNGGGGLVCARRLNNWGYETLIALPKGKPTRKIPSNQFSRAKRVGVTVIDDLPKSDDIIIIDALIGYNFQGQIRKNILNSINFMQSKEVISLDIPTGINSNTGEDVGKIEPLATVTLAWPKNGMLKLNPKSLGDVYLADIGVPIQIFNRINLFEDKRIPNQSQLNQISRVFSSDSAVAINIKPSGWKIEEPQAGIEPAT